MTRESQTRRNEAIKLRKLERRHGEIFRSITKKKTEHELNPPENSGGNRRISPNLDVKFRKLRHGIPEVWIKIVRRRDVSHLFLLSLDRIVNWILNCLLCRIRATCNWCISPTALRHTRLT
jgi:hypothetical protein